MIEGLKGLGVPAEVVTLIEELRADARQMMKDSNDAAHDAALAALDGLGWRTGEDGRVSRHSRPEDVAGAIFRALEERDRIAMKWAERLARTLPLKLAAIVHGMAQDDKSEARTCAGARCPDSFVAVARDAALTLAERHADDKDDEAARKAWNDLFGALDVLSDTAREARAAFDVIAPLALAEDGERGEAFERLGRLLAAL